MIRHGFEHRYAPAAHLCSFIDAALAIASFAGDALAAGAGAVEAGGAALAGGVGEAAAGVEGAAAGLGSTVAGGLESLGIGGGAAGGTAALDAGAAGGLGTLEGGAGAAAGGTSALEGAGAGAGLGAGGVGGAAATTPLAALDSGAATSVLDTGAGLGSSGSALSFAPTEVGGTTAFPISAGAAQDTLNLGTAESILPFGSTGTGADLAGAATTGATTGGSAAGITGGAGTAALDTGAAGGAAGAIDASASGADVAAGGGAAGGAGGGGTLGSITSGIKTAAPILGLGNLAYQAIKGPPALPQEATQLSGLGASLGATGQQNLTMAANQQITASQAQQIETWKQQQKNQLYQLYASKGLDPNKSTDYLQAVQQIDAQGVAMQQQFIDQLVKTGLGETGQATGALTSAANMQIQNDQAFQTSLSNAIRAFGTTVGGGGLNLKVA